MSKMEVSDFEKLIENAAKIHALTYCIIRKAYLKTKDLEAEECLDCLEFVCNEGCCDPL